MPFLPQPSYGFFYLHTMDYVRLEYSEQQQMFHFNTGDRPPETNGYVTIESHIERDNALELIKDIRRTFNGIVITLEMVNDYFNANLSEDE